MATATIDELAKRDKDAIKRQKALDLKLLATLAELGGSKTAADEVVFEGKRIVLPENLTMASAIEFLQSKMKDENQIIEFSRVFKYRPWDGAHAVVNVFNRVGGMWTQKPTMGFWGPNPPEMVTIDTGFNKTEQIPWSAVQVPFLPGVIFYLESDRLVDQGELFKITVSGPKMYKHQVEGVFKMIEEELKSNSIYRGKAIDASSTPQFLDLSGVDERRVTYSDEVIAQLNANVWTTLEHTNLLRSLAMPIKRAALLEGPYGTGKTLAAFLTAKRAVANQWTFIYVKPGQDLVRSLQTARMYEPAVVFFEDLDALDTEGKDKTSVVLDAFDGITAKGAKILILLTTNHPELIHKGMVRPGRLDAVIHIGSLDLNGIRRLIESHVNPDVLGDLDFAAIYTAMDGFVPAFAVEAIGRAQRYAIARTGQAPKKLETADFVEAALGLQPQLALMNADEKKNQPTVDDLVENRMAQVMAKSRFYCSDCKRVHTQDWDGCINHKK